MKGRELCRDPACASGPVCVMGAARLLVGSHISVCYFFFIVERYKVGWKRKYATKTYFVWKRVLERAGRGMEGDAVTGSVFFVGVCVCVRDGGWAAVLWVKGEECMTLSVIVIVSILNICKAFYIALRSNLLFRCLLTQDNSCEVHCVLPLSLSYLCLLFFNAVSFSSFFPFVIIHQFPDIFCKHALFLERLGICYSNCLLLHSLSFFPP